jgi:methionyl-tRNA synthetase
MDGVVPEYDISKFPALQQHKEEVDKHLQEYIANLKTLKLRAGLAAVMRYFHPMSVARRPLS